MTDLSPSASFRERLEWAMKRHSNISQSELARQVGIKPQSIQHLLDPKKNAQGSSHTANIAKALQVSAHWLATGEGKPLQIDSLQLIAQFRALAAQHRNAATDTDDPAYLQELFGGAIEAMAHDMSQARNTESLPRIGWEELMEADMSRPFELEVIDDALAPEIFRGCIALMDPDRPPEPGWPVLVRDRDNHHYLRDYKVGVGSRWSAVPRSAQRDMFDPLDSETHGLVVIAAMDGYKRPRRVAR